MEKELCSELSQDLTFTTYLLTKMIETHPKPLDQTTHHRVLQGIEFRKQVMK